MDIQTELSKIKKDINGGRLDSALTLIKNLPDDNYKNQIYVNIFSCICMFVAQNNYNPKKTISVPQLKEILFIIKEEIKEPQEKIVINYLRSLYHTLRFLVKKISFEEFYPLSELIVPSWLPENIENVFEMMSHFYAFLNNEILLTISKKNEPELIKKYAYFHLRLGKLIYNERSTTFFTKFLLYCNILQKFQDKKYTSDFCTEIIELLDDIEQLPDKETRNEFFKSFSMIIYYYFLNSENEYEKIRPKIDKVFQIMNKFSSSDNELKMCTNVFRDFYNLCSRDIKSYEQNDVELFKNILKDFENLLKTYGYNPMTSTTYRHASLLLRLVIDLFEKTDHDTWNSHMSADIQIHYIKLITHIGTVLAKTEYECDCINKCQIKTGLISAISTLKKCSTFENISTKASTKFTNDSETEIFNLVLTALKYSCKYIEILKNKNCDKWIMTWKSVGAITYNITTRFNRNENIYWCKTFSYFLIKYILIFQGIENKNSFIENSLSRILYNLCITFYNIKDYMNALTYLAIAIKLSITNTELYWTLWCKIKSVAIKENVSSVGDLTISYIMKRDKEIIKKLYPDYVFDKNEITELLLTEIESYAKHWPSKISMNTTCKKYLNKCTDPLKRTYAIGLSWHVVKNLLDHEFMEHVTKTIALLTRKDVRNNLETQLCLSILYYIDYQIKREDIQMKNLNEMNQTIRPEKSTVNYEEENPDDKCNIHPTYCNNRLNKIVELQKILNKSIDLWNKILDDENINEIKESIEKLNLSNYILNTAFEYRLQNYKYQMLKIWFLYLKYGDVFKDKNIIVTAIGFILETTDFNIQIELVKKAENFLNDIELETSILYHINKSTGQLNSNLLKKGVESLQTAEELYENFKEKTGVDYKLESRILFLKSAYLRKPCSLELMDHTTDCIVLLQRGYRKIVNHCDIRSKGNCLYSLSLYFDFSYEIGNLFFALKMPRELRSYTAETIILAQEIVLPLRTVQFFSLLAFTDLLDMQLDDCKVKMSGIDYILGFKSNKNFNIEEVTTEFENFSLKTEPIDEVMLDIPVNVQRKNLRGSPILASKSFKIPYFIYHINCHCQYCVNLDYQKLILEYTHLEALYYLRGDNLFISNEYFKGGLRIYNGILKIHEQVLSSDLSGVFIKSLKLTYGKLLLDLSYYYAKTGDYEQTLKNNNLIFELLGDNIETDSYFYHEVLMQKLHIITAIELKKIEKKTPLKTVDFEIPIETEANSNISTTPENKVSLATVSVKTTPNFIPTPKHMVRKQINFDSSSEDEKTPVRKYKFKTPAKTPLPKIVINSPETLKKEKLNLNLSPDRVKTIKFPKSESKFKSLRLLDKEFIKNSTKKSESAIKKNRRLKSDKENISHNKNNVIEQLIDGITNIDFSDDETQIEKKTNIVKEKPLKETRSLRSKKIENIETLFDDSNEINKLNPEQKRVPKTRRVNKNEVDCENASKENKNGAIKKTTKKPTTKKEKNDKLTDEASSHYSVRSTRRKLN